MSEAPLVVDLARVLLAVVAGGTLLQLSLVTWADWRTGDVACFPLQLAALLTLARIAADTSVRVGEPAVLHLLLLRYAIVALLTGYALARQGYLDRWVR